MNSTESHSSKAVNDISSEAACEVITMESPALMDSSGQLSIAKITAPRLLNIFPRNRLFCLLDRASERSVIWVCAPAGSGKTTLVASWLAARRIPVQWYQVDEGDADPASFFYYMGLAARKAVPHLHHALPLFTPEYLLGIQTFTRRYFEELFSLFKTPCTVVFDNYQEASLESLFHEVIRDGVNVAPPGITIIFISRNIPPAIMAPLIAGRRLTTIGWEEIRLTLDETAGIAGLYGKEESKPFSVVGQIHEMAQGWAAGVILMLEAMLRIAGSPFRGFDGDLTEVFAYFAEEILEKISPEIREFLLRSSLLPKMTAIMAEKLTGFEGVHRILSHLVRNHYFTQKHVHLEPVYQYHPLFREFLLSQAKNTLPLVELVRLQRLAATLLADKGEIESALALMREANDWDGVAGLIAGQAKSLMAQGRIGFLDEWLTAIPEEIAERYVWPLYWLGLCRLPFDPMVSRRLFKLAFHLFQCSGDAAGVLLAWAGGVETFLYVMDEFVSLDEWVDRLDDFLGDAPSFPSPEIEAHVAFGMTFALLWRQPDHPGLGMWVNRSLTLSHTISDANLRIKLCSNIVTYFCWMGEFVKCRLFLDDVGLLARTNDVSPLFLISWKISQAIAFGTSVSTLGQALQSVVEGTEIAMESGVHLLDYMLDAHGVYGSLHTANTELVGGYLTRMAAKVSYNQRNTMAQLHYLQAWYHLLLGNLSQSLAHAEQAVDLVVATGTPFPEMMCRIVKSLILHDLGEDAMAVAELGGVRQLAGRTGSTYFEYLSYLTEALCRLDRDREAEGLRALRNAMTIGKKQGYETLLLWWRPADMARLCCIALDEEIAVGYVRELVRKLGLVTKNPLTQVENWPWPVKVRTLGRFCLELSGKPVVFSGKVQERPLTLLKAIIALGAREVSEERLCDYLWPNADGHAAYHSYATNLHRLRKLLGQEQALLVQGGKVTLNPRVVWVDALAFDQLTGEGEAESHQANLMQEAMKLYGGHFLDGDPDVLWAVSRRERMRSKLLRIVTCEGARLEQAGEWEKAIACYRKGLETDELIEEYYQRLMVCYSHQGKRGNVLSLYRRCCNVLAILGLKPSAVTRAVYEEAAADSVQPPPSSP